MNHPLINNASKEKTWIVPLKITVLVDDPSLYDDRMLKLVKDIKNEVKRTCAHFDKSRKQLFIDFGDIVKDPKVWEHVVAGSTVPNDSDLEKKILDVLAKLKHESN